MRLAFCLHGVARAGGAFIVFAWILAVFAFNPDFSLERGMMARRVARQFGRGKETRHCEPRRGAAIQPRPCKGRRRCIEGRMDCRGPDGPRNDGAYIAHTGHSAQ